MTFSPTDLANTALPEAKTKKKTARNKTADVTANGAETSLDVGDAEPAPDDATDLASQAVRPTTLIELPIGNCFPGYVSRRLDCRCTPRQAAAARVLWSSLANRGDRYENGRALHPEGKSVESHNDGIRWLLDRLADAIEAESGCDLLKDFDIEIGV